MNSLQERVHLLDELSKTSLLKVYTIKVLLLYPYRQRYKMAVSSQAWLAVDIKNVIRRDHSYQDVIRAYGDVDVLVFPGKTEKASATLAKAFKLL